MSNATPEVLAMAQINFSGNIIPNSWYQHLTYDNGKPHLGAIVILSDIVYWYRPVEIRDEVTGRTIGHNKRFAADKLQRSYGQISNQFGLTKKQARDAINFLDQKGVITKELRQIDTINGPLSNVLFIGILPEKIAEISLPKVAQVTPSDLQVTPSDLQVTPSVPTSHTYTESTAKTTTESLANSQNSQPNGNAPSSPDHRMAEKLEGLANAIAKTAGNDNPLFVKGSTLLALDICKLCGLDIMTIVSRKTQEALVSITIALYTHKVSNADLTKFGSWWYDNTWQGKKRQPPTPEAIGDSWGQFEAQKVAPPSNGPTLTDAQKKRLEELIAENG